MPVSAIIAAGFAHFALFLPVSSDFGVHSLIIPLKLFVEIL